MYYIFVVNDIEYNHVNIQAESIVDTLLKKQLWLYNSNTPNLKRITKGDKILVYVAGKGRRFFCARFEIADNIGVQLEGPSTVEETVLFRLYKLGSKIAEIQVFQPTIPIEGLINKLSFIKDKVNYGLFFRQSTKVISEEDFLTVLNARKS